ncbi:MAG: hypothetical protein ACE5HX_08130, partial [bacterium]
MRDKKIKLIYFSLEASQAKQIEISWVKFSILLGTAFLILLIFTSFTMALLTDFYHNVKIASLSKINKVLEVKLVEIKDKMSQ